MKNKTKFIHFKNDPAVYGWVIFCSYILLISNLSFAGNIKKTNNKVLTINSIYSVKYNKLRKTYTTISRVIGGEKQYEPEGLPILLKTFRSANTTINLLTFENLKSQVQTKTKNILYLDKAPPIIEKYLNLIGIQAFPITFNLILIPNEYDFYYESQTKSTKGTIELSFVSPVVIDSPLQLFELRTLSVIPHELFHFLGKHDKKIPRMNLLREETYAHLFGQCAAYELNPVIMDSMILNFPDYFFKEPNEDFPKVIKKLKKGKLNTDTEFPKSHLGRAFSRYYFQAVANERNGEKIISERIPKFCQKLFSERNFKHPIEKKPPLWLKVFLNND